MFNSAEEMEKLLETQGMIKPEEGQGSDTGADGGGNPNGAEKPDGEEKPKGDSSGEGQNNNSTFDELKLVEHFKANYGLELSSPEDFKTLKDKVAVAGQYEAEKAKLEEQMRFYTKPFATEGIENFNNFVKHTNIDNYNIFKKLSLINPDEVDAIEAITLNKVLETPELADDYDIMRKQVERSYPLTVGGDADPDDEDFKLETLFLKQEKIKAIKALSEMKAKAFAQNGQGQKPWTEDDSTALQTKWNPIAEKILEKLGKAEFKLKGEETFPYEIEPELKAKYVKEALGFAVNNRMETSEQNVTAVATNIYHRIRSENLEKILQSATTHLMSEAVRERILKYNNPSGTEKPKGEGSGEERPETQEEMYKRITGRGLGEF